MFLIFYSVPVISVSGLLATLQEEWEHFRALWLLLLLFTLSLFLLLLPPILWCVVLTI